MDGVICDFNAGWMELHKDEKPVFISGEDVRNTLLKGEMVDERIMRPSTSRILAAAMKK